MAPTILEQGFAVQRSFKVQADDIDPSGLVSELAYLRWLEALRSQLLTQQLEDHYPSQSPMLFSSQIDYRRPLAAGTTLMGRCWLANLGHTRWTLQTRLWQPRLFSGGDTVATAIQILQLINRDNLGVVPVPEALTHRYWSYQWSQ